MTLSYLIKLEASISIIVVKYIKLHAFQITICIILDFLWFNLKSWQDDDGTCEMEPNNSPGFMSMMSRQT